MMVNEQLDNIEAMVKDIHEAIYVGNGPSDPPLMTRVDRLEQTQHQRTWLMRTSIGAAVTAVVVAVYNLLTGK